VARRRGDGFGEVDWSRFDWREFSRLRRGREGPPRRTIVFFLVAFVVLLIPALLRPLVTFLTDVLWFRSLGLESVYLRQYTAAFWAFVFFALVFFAFAALNAIIAARIRLPRAVVDVGERPRSIPGSRILAAVLLVPAAIFGLAAGDRWQDILRFLNATPFGRADPLFGQDISFYFFTLPMLSFLRGWAMAALIITALGVALLYLARGTVGVFTGGPVDAGTGARMARAIGRPARAHLSVLGALFLLLIAAGYQLDRYELLFRAEGPFLTGAGYASVNARLPALGVLTGIAVLAAALLVANVWARTLWLLGGTIGAWLLASVVLSGVYPALVERFVVQPAQLELERPYIERHLAATREAYGIATVEESSFDVRDEPTPDDVRRDLSSIENVRIWDYSPLQQTLTQLQALRGYYDFPDVDVTRASVGGRVQQIMVAARELQPDRIPRQWVNQHLFYTHGYGAVANPVSAVTAEGQPALSLKDIPPQGEPRVDRPQIYFGELTREYIVVGTSQDEFDYPKANVDEVTRFAGGGGISVGNVWNRLLFASRFGDVNLLISSQIGAESRLLMHRQVVERAQLIAPFLLFDHDPYLAFDEGRLFWIHDAYTTGERYPYAEAIGTARLPGAEGLGYADLNYLRNSVKVVTDAYDGTVRFYVADPEDPVVETWRKIFPELLQPLDRMPPVQRAQLRYPEDLFRIQAAVYGRYHVTDAVAFYNASDQWQVANELIEQGGQAQPIEPYYVITRLPGAERAEFLLFVPMTPNGRNNMIGWLAGRSDEPNYGQLRALRFATDRTIFGPLQIEARIDADPVIKTQLALLSQAGTRVIRGNLLVIPVGSSFLYVEPIFIVAQTGSIPELRRIVLATQTRVVMEDTFPRALAAIFGAPAAPTQPPPTTQPPSGSASAEVQALVRSASDHYSNAQTALRAGDFATYGVEIAALERDLARLRELTGVR
jgi:uncharacterized membrane protein (UPF0182 family)